MDPKDSAPTGRGGWWGMIAAAAAVVFLGAAYVGWRMTTPTECAWVSAYAGSWQEVGVRPTVVDGVADCPVRAGETIVGARVAGDTAVLSRPGGDEVVAALEPPGSLLLARLVDTGATLAFCAGFFGLSLYAALRRRRRAPLTMLLLAAGLLGSTLAVAVGLPVHQAFGGAPGWVFLANVQAVYLLAWGAGAAWLLLFPTPVVPGRAGDRAWLACLLAPVTLWGTVMAVVSLAPTTFSATTFPGWARVSILVQSSLTLTLVAGCLALLALRVRRALVAPPGDVPRQQILWVAGSALVSGILAFALWMLPQLLTGSALLPDDLIGAPGLILVAGLAVAVTRYRLFDLDVVLGRTIVYSVLVLVAVFLYVGVTGVVAALVGSRTPTPVVVAVLVALALNPLRVRLERLVNRAFYGERNDPYAALSRLATRIADRATPLSAVAADIASALRTRYVAIRTAETAAVFGETRDARADDVLVPIRSEDDTLGTLTVGTRVAGERFSRSERRLLDDLAAQIGHRVRERRLVRELHTSREHIVTAREEERRTLRRTLHDDVGPTMAAIALRAETVRRLLGRDPPAAGSELDPVLTEISREASAAAHSLRELSYRLRPPSLDEHGLVDALRLHTGSVPGIDVHLVAPDPDGQPPLSAAVEAAAYRIIVAALANVVSHAHARACWVTLAPEEGRLTLLVEDDGVGLVDGTPRGVGLSAMAERAAELGGTLSLGPRDGGGLQVRAELPTGGPA